MTGYGWSRTESERCTVTVELKSLNSKYLEVTAKLPRHYVSQELAVRNAVTQRLQRGKVSVQVAVASKVEASAAPSALIDTAYLGQLLAALQPYVQRGAVALPNAAELLQLPGVLLEAEASVADDEWAQVQQTLEHALNELVDSRRREGRALEADLRARVQTIGQLAERVPPLERERAELVKQRLAANLAEWTGGSAQADDRFQQELIYYLERNDITEERVRLAAHLKLFTATLDAAESQGRKLGFVAQEMGREINTLGAKANHSGLQALVVEMKDELEKIKEQLNNLL